MATPTNDQNTFSIDGKITDQNKAGLSDLIVTIYDIRPDVHPASIKDLETLLKIATRLGSTSTDGSGTFLFTYGPSVQTVLQPEKKSFNLLITVSAPDTEKASSASRIIFFSNPPRYNAGKSEHFNIRISTDTLVKFSIADDTRNTSVNKSIDEKIQDYKNENSFRIKFETGLADFHKQEVITLLKDKQLFRADFKKRIATNFETLHSGLEIVKEGDSIEEVTTKVVENSIGHANDVFNDGSGVPFTLYLTPSDRQKLFGNTSSGSKNLPEKDVREILYRATNTDNPGTLLIHDNPIEKFCQAQSADQKCALNHTGLSSEEDTTHTTDISSTPGDMTGDNVTAVTDSDIPKFIARLVENMPSPDHVLTPEFNNQRADKTQIEKTVDEFSLNKGPAETPSFFDFYSLQIAFEHVWKQLLDENIIEAANTANETLKNRFGLDFNSFFGANLSFENAIQGVISTTTTALPTANPEVVPYFDITDNEWNNLTPALQLSLLTITRLIARNFGKANLELYLQKLRDQGERIIDKVRTDDYTNLHKILKDLQERLKGKYEFTVFAADKDYHFVNFGILNTFRQKWVPLNYQAGKLVKTMALSPKEERKYALKINQTTRHSTREAIKNNSSFTSEQSSTARVESDIISKAQNKTNFSLSATGDYDIAISKGSSTTNFGTEAASDSSNDRKDFHESVLKAAQEYKEERSVEINTEETTSTAFEESGTVVNPNDELAVTYLFYELQRRYRISEQLYRVMPVVLVAQEVPAPDHITEAWVISYDWIINRVLLDDSFRTSLKYLATKSVGDDFEIRELRKNLRQQRDLVDSLKIEFARASSQADSRYAALEADVNKRIDEESSEKTDGWFSDVGDFFGGGGQDPEAAKARELAAQDAYQHALDKAQAISTNLKVEVNSLHKLTEAFNKAMRTHLDNETQIKRLLVHIRNNILYYMQAIWSMEPPDQRFLRLHKVKVANLETDGSRTYTVEVTPDPQGDIFAQFRPEGTTKHSGIIKGKLKKPVTFKPLVEIADLDTMIGFKGNYMIFPLKQHNALTEFMAAPYIDNAFGAMDPDQLSNINLEEYSKYICCLHDKLTTEKFEELKPVLRDWLEKIIANPLRNGDEIVVPTNSLFIECLPGAKPLLENFKLRHRELDVYKVQAEVRKAEMENLRLASRLLNAEREDPDVDRKIVVEGAGIIPGLDVDPS